MKPYKNLFLKQFRGAFKNCFPGKMGLRQVCMHGRQNYSLEQNEG